MLSQTRSMSTSWLDEVAAVTSIQPVDQRRFNLGTLKNYLFH